MSVKRPEAADWRLAIYGDGKPDRTDLVGVMALAMRSQDPDLLALVADVARDALLVEGQIACEDADWLMEACGDGHGLGSYAEFEALTSVLRHAAPAPAELVAFAAREVERAILTGERAHIGGADGEPGCVTASDVAALREICGGKASDRALAEVLFDIAHATASADNDPGFDILFAQGLWAYLSGEIPSGERFKEFLAGLDAGPAAAAPEPVDGLADEGYYRAAQTVAIRHETASRLSAGGAKWALAHLSRGDLTSAERRLVQTLRDPAVSFARQAA